MWHGDISDMRSGTRVSRVVEVTRWLATIISDSSYHVSGLNFLSSPQRPCHKHTQTCHHGNHGMVHWVMNLGWTRLNSILSTHISLPSLRSFRDSFIIAAEEAWICYWSRRPHTHTHTHWSCHDNNNLDETSKVIIGRLRLITNRYGLLSDQSWVEQLADSSGRSTHDHCGVPKQDWRHTG